MSTSRNSAGDIFGKPEICKWIRKGLGPSPDEMQLAFPIPTKRRGIYTSLKSGSKTLGDSLLENGVLAGANSIILNITSCTIKAGETENVIATVLPANALNKSVTWKTANPSVATVNDGAITGVQAGTTTITATTSNGKTATCKVTVEKVISWYPEGMYRVGTDIPAGGYYAISTNDYSGYYCIYKDRFQDDIHQNDNFDTFTFFYCTNGQYLKLSRCKITPISNVPNSIADSENGVYSEGTYRVGVDIPAGEYRITQDGKYDGYYCIYSDITKESIVKNGFAKGTAYCTVTSGQYLKVNRATFVLVSSSDNVSDEVGPGNNSESNADSGDNRKYSVQDAQSLSRYIRAGTEQVNTASDFAMKAHKRGNETIRVANLKLGISAAQSAMANYKAALSLLNNRVELTYTDGGSVNEDVQSIYDALESLDDISTEEEDIEESSSKLANTIQDIQLKEIRVMKAITQLLNAFL